MPGHLSVTVHLVTPHFTVEEFACRDLSPYPPGWVEERLLPLCQLLEALRADLGGRAVRVLSGYRSPAWNEHVGGARASRHMQGDAADVTVDGLAPSDVYAAAIRLHERGAIRLGGAGLYG